MDRLEFVVRSRDDDLRDLAWWKVAKEKEREVRCAVSGVSYLSVALTVQCFRFD